MGKPTVTKIYLVIDFGSSLTRAIYCLKYSDGTFSSPELITLPPYCLKVSESRIKQILANTLHPTALSPEIGIWLSVAREWYLVGDLAKSERRSEMSLSRRKLVYALPTTLAIVGAVVQKEFIFKQDIPLVLGILLPFSEYQDRNKYQKYITQSLSSFNFKGDNYAFSVERFTCRPEGAGIFAKGRDLNKLRHTSITNINILVVIIGYRNVSSLFIEKGNLAKGRTADFGMNYVIELMKNLTSGYKDDQLLEIIIKGLKGTGEEDEVNTSALEPLVKNLPAQMQQDELNCLAQAVLDSRHNYLNILSEWIEQLVIGTKVDEVLVSGGTFHTFRKQLTPLLRTITGCMPGYGLNLEQRVNQEFTCSVIKKLGLSSRLVDAYGFFLWLTGQPLPKLKKSQGKKNAREKSG